MSSTDTTIEVTVPVPTTVRITGQVKWFNNKAGYGFITVNSGEQSGKDIFVHYSAIRVTNSQYKYLVQGEYVEFDLVSSKSETHEYQAVDISGINGGWLMCETRRNSVNPSNNRYQHNGDKPKPRPPRVQVNNENVAPSDYTPVNHGKQRRRVSTKPIAASS